MSQYYITPNETPISVTKINEVLGNHPSSSAFSGLIGAPGQQVANSKISSLAEQSYQYLFSQKITSSFYTPDLTTFSRRPIKFSDFRNNLFFASDVVIKGETPSKYGNLNDGSIKIIPLGGTGNTFKITIYVPTEITYIDGYTQTKSRASDCGHKQNFSLICKNHPIKYTNIPIYKTRMEDIIVAQTECLAGGNLSKVVDTGTYYVKVEQLDNRLTVINSYEYTVVVGWGEKAVKGQQAVNVLTTERKYFSR